jgi:outer membrane protein assembly factor BamB
MNADITGAETMRDTRHEKNGPRAPRKRCLSKLLPVATAARLLGLLLAVPATFLAVPVFAADWPDWRGPNLDRHAGQQNLVTSFDTKKGTNVLWTNEEAGSISTPVILDGRLYTLVRHRPGTMEEAEKVVCLDAVTGKKLWENVFNVYLSDVPAERVGWSCVVADPVSGAVFAHGVCGVFSCIDAVTGQTRWQRSLHEEFGFLSTYGGRTNVPVVFEDLVIASAVVTGWGTTARPAHRFLGMDVATGEVRWTSGTRELPEDTTYSTPSIGDFGGAAALVFGSSDGSIWNLQPRTGKPVWNCRLSPRGINVSPLIDGTVVYAGQGEENLDRTTMGSATAIAVDGSGDITESGRIWQVKEVLDGRAMPVVLGDRVYFTDITAKLFIFDKATGKPIGKPQRLLGTIARASPLVADGKLFVCTTSGWHVLEPTDTGLKFVNRMRLDADDEVTASPIAWQGRLYLTTGERLYCLGSNPAEASEAKSPGQLRVAEVSEKTKGPAGSPAWVQVVPAELQVAAGESVTFRVRLFDEAGRFVKESPATFTCEVNGAAVADAITSDGVYTAPAGTHAGAVITATVDGLSGTARVRSMPPLPWSFDFEQIPLATDPRGGPPKGDPPLPWLGMRYRHVVREVDGSKCLVKVTTIPKGTRSQGWIGPIDLADYAMTADFRAAEFGGASPAVVAATESTSAGEDESLPPPPPASGTTADLSIARLPDMGLIAQRYTLDLMGASQQLQLRTWPPQVATHFSVTVPYAWEAGRWYRMRFEATREGNDAVLRGKVWPRDEPEPEEWTVTGVHPGGNLQGSPGFFGNAKDSEIAIDNVRVESLDAEGSGSR